METNLDDSIIEVIEWAIDRLALYRGTQRAREILNTELTTFKLDRCNHVRTNAKTV